ncbi:MAG: hypothetical protein JO141_19730 [Bradyrhizobium sp.]|nr:hypothetical protein [Bradyrhizobium sp.]
MADVLETTVAPAAIERAMTIFEKFAERDHAELVQARKALTEHIFGQVAAGQADEERLVVAGLARLKTIERMNAEATKNLTHSSGPGEPEDGGPSAQKP